MTDELGGRYFREARFFLAGDKVAAQSHILEARSLMGYMRDQLALGGPAIQVQYATLQDGTQIKATMMNGQYQAQIVSPRHGAVIGGGGYEVWVRPLWSPVVFTSSGPYAPEDYDWLVTPASGCSATAEHMTPRLYSNRMWQAPDKSIYCIVGGYDKSKYTGAAGAVISRDGEVVDTDSGIVGVGVFRGQLVKVTHALSTPNIGGIDRDQVVYTVSVGGIVKFVTPTIDAYVDGGYARGVDLSNIVNDYGFSQNIVVFNSDASEGSCVLGNAARLVFSLTVDDVGEVVVTHEVVAIPGADGTYIPVTGAIGSVTNTCTTNGSAISVTQYSLSDSREAGAVYTVAITCDYVVGVDGTERVIYMLLETRDLMSPAGYTELSYTGSAAIVCDFFGCYPTNVTSTLSEQYDSFSGVRNTLKLSTGETIYKFGTWGSTHILRVGTHADRAAETHISGSAASVVALDLKHGFVMVTDNSKHTYVTSVEDLDGSQGGGTGGTGVTVVTSTSYAVPDPVCTTYSAGFVRSNGLVTFTYGDLPVTTTVTNPASYGGFSVDTNCYYMSANISGSTDTRAYGVPVRTDSKLRAKGILLYEDKIFTPPALLSCGIVTPTDKDAWDSATVFICVPDAPAEVHSVCATGASSDVTSQFVDPALSDSEPTTKHFGIIRKRGK